MPREEAPDTMPFTVDTLGKPDPIFQIVFNIDGSLDSRGCAWEAKCEMTTTGVRWTINGYLALAIVKAINGRT